MKTITYGSYLTQPKHGLITGDAATSSLLQQDVGKVDEVAEQ